MSTCLQETRDEPSRSAVDPLHTLRQMSISFDFTNNIKHKHNYLSEQVYIMKSIQRKKIPCSLNERICTRFVATKKNSLVLSMMERDYAYQLLK